MQVHAAAVIPTIIELVVKVAVLRAPGSSDELWSFSVGRSPTKLIAGGGNAKVLDYQ